MVWYNKKKDILKRLWKWEKDVRYLDRMIRIWKVIKRWWEYALREEEGNDEAELAKAIAKAKEELEMYKEVAEWYKEIAERKEYEAAHAKEIYWHKLWRYLKKKINISDEDYEDFMRFLDS